MGGPALPSSCNDSHWQGWPYQRHAGDAAGECEVTELPPVSPSYEQRNVTIERIAVEPLWSVSMLPFAQAHLGLQT